VECAKGQLDIEVDDDFGRLFHLYDTMPERSAAAPTFDPRHSDAISGFWFLGRERESRRIVHLQAVGLINLGRRTLGDYLRDRAWLYHPYGEDVSPPHCSFPAQGAAQIRGQVCYQGELWVRPGKDGFQGLRLAQELVRFALVLAENLFAPDFMWAFVSERNARVRFPQRSGYRYTEADGVVWRNSAEEVQLREWLVWADRPNLVDLAAQERDAQVLRPIAQNREDRAAVG